jgi:beta-galactosidase
VESNGQTHDWFSWGEILEPNDGTTSLAHYADQYYAGDVAAVTRPLGRGTVTYVGVDTQDGALEAHLLRGVFARANVPVENFAQDFLVDWRDGFWVATNFTEKVHAAPIPAGATVLVGGRDVPTAGVTVWQE